MSLHKNTASHAVSLYDLLSPDGSINKDTIKFMPSLIRVDYSLIHVGVDKMLDQGIWYFEEWGLGVFSTKVNRRRELRIGRRSTEGFVPRPIPQDEVKVTKCMDRDDDNDGLRIVMKVKVTHTTGMNARSVSLDNGNSFG